MKPKNNMRNNACIIPRRRCTRRFLVGRSLVITSFCFKGVIGILVSGRSFFGLPGFRFKSSRLITFGSISSVVCSGACLLHCSVQNWPFCLVLVKSCSSRANFAFDDCSSASTRLCRRFNSSSVCDSTVL